MVTLYGNCYWNLHYGCHVFCTCNKGDAVRNIKDNGFHECKEKSNETQLKCYKNAVKWLKGLKQRSGWENEPESVQKSFESGRRKKSRYNCMAGFKAGISTKMDFLFFSNFTERTGTGS